MRRYFLKRLGLALITLVLVSLAVFGVAEVLPGDVGRTILGPYASNEQVERLNHGRFWSGTASGSAVSSLVTGANRSS